jgi:hypothetical protein
VRPLVDGDLLAELRGADGDAVARDDQTLQGLHLGRDLQRQSPELRLEGARALPCSRRAVRLVRAARRRLDEAELHPRRRELPGSLVALRQEHLRPERLRHEPHRLLELRASLIELARRHELLAAVEQGLRRRRVVRVGRRTHGQRHTHHTPSKQRLHVHTSSREGRMELTEGSSSPLKNSRRQHLRVISVACVAAALPVLT